VARGNSSRGDFQIANQFAVGSGPRGNWREYRVLSYLPRPDLDGF